MALEKLKIKPLPPSKLKETKLKEIEVLFNPTSYSIRKTVTWSALQQSSNGANGQTERAVNAPVLSFGGGSSRTLALELFFDVTEPINGRPISDVRVLTNRVVALTRIERDNPKKQPPVCEISWGNAPPGSDFPFVGVVSSLEQSFTLFKSNGNPVRAKLAVAFTEFLDPEKDQRENDPELTVHTVKRADTLSSIAAANYRNPALWRLIAIENQLDDPRQLQPGLRLTIPKMR